MASDPGFEELRRRHAEAEVAGGEDRVRRQHKAGKQTARERLGLLLDPGSFTEMDKFVVHQSHDFGMEEQRIPGDGVVTGTGRIHGRPVFVFAIAPPFSKHEAPVPADAETRARAACAALLLPPQDLSPSGVPASLAIHRRGQANRGWDRGNRTFARPVSSVKTTMRSASILEHRRPAA